MSVEPSLVNALKLATREFPAAESECIPRTELNRLVEVCDGQPVLAGLIVGKPLDLVAANVVGDQVELAGERIDRPLEIPAFYEHSAFVQMERSGRRRRDVRDWYGRGRAVICGVGLGMNGGVIVKVGLGTATCSV